MFLNTHKTFFVHTKSDVGTRSFSALHSIVTHTMLSLYYIGTFDPLIQRNTFIQLDRYVVDIQDILDTGNSKEWTLTKYC